MPVGAETLRDAVRMGSEIFHTLKAELKAAGHSTNVGDEGGFAPDIASTRAALDFVMAAIRKAGYTPGDDVLLALDAAATEFFEDGSYDLAGEDLPPRQRRHGRLPGRARRRLSRSPRSRTAWPRTTGRAGAC